MSRRRAARAAVDAPPRPSTGGGSSGSSGVGGGAGAGAGAGMGGKGRGGKEQKGDSSSEPRIKIANSASGAVTLIIVESSQADRALLNKLTGLLSRNKLDIMEADVSRSATGGTRGSFTVSTTGESLAVPPERWDDLRRQIEAKMAPKPRAVDCQVRMHHREYRGKNAVEVRVTASNSPALLAKIANVFATNGLEVISADCRTEDDGKVVDNFLLIGLEGPEEEWLSLQQQIQEAAMPSEFGGGRGGRSGTAGGSGAASVAGNQAKGGAAEEARGLPPTGWMVLCFTDIQNSTRLWDEDHRFMGEAIGVHDWVVRSCLSRHGGYEVKGGGDGFFCAFRDPQDAVRFALELQEELLQAAWPAGVDDRGLTAPRYSSAGRLLWRGLRVRVGLHIGNPLSNMVAQTRRMDYLGPDVNVASRVCDQALGGEVLATEALTAALLCARSGEEMGDLSDCVIHPGGLDALRDTTLSDLGEHPLRGVKEPMRLTRLLPTSLAGREQELAAARQAKSGQQKGARPGGGAD